MNATQKLLKNKIIAGMQTSQSSALPTVADHLMDLTTLVGEIKKLPEDEQLLAYVIYALLFFRRYDVKMITSFLVSVKDELPDLSKKAVNILSRVQTAADPVDYVSFNLNDRYSTKTDMTPLTTKLECLIYVVAMYGKEDRYQSPAVDEMHDFFHALISGNYKQHLKDRRKLASQKEYAEQVAGRYIIQVGELYG